MSSPELLEQTQISSHPETQNIPETNTPEQQKWLRVKKTLGRVALATGLVAASTTGALVSETLEAPEYLAFAETGGYPNYNAQPHNTAVYEWWVDENGNNRKDVTAAENDNDELMSSRGYYYRNCTDYLAWQAMKEFGVSVSGWGHAANWDNSARGKYAVNNTPEPGDIAVREGGYGHVAFVRSVNQDGSVNISQYNAKGDGNYSTQNNQRFDNYIDINGEGKAWGGQTAPGGGTSGEFYQSFMGDFNGDMAPDIGLRNPSTGMFYARYAPSYTNQTEFTWDNSTAYQSFMGDFNGDKVADVGLRNPKSGAFYARFGPSFTNQTMFNWDNSTNYQSFMGDFNGDKVVDVGLRDPSSGMFYSRFGPDFTNQIAYRWDNSTNYQSFMGNFNGDNAPDIGLRNPSTGMFYARFGPNFTSQTTFKWDNSTNYQSFMGDFNGDKVVDVGLRNPNTGTFYIRSGPNFTDQTIYTWDRG